MSGHNKGAWLTISAFGLSGPRAGDAGTELSIAAASGMLAIVRDEATGQPLKLGGQQSLLNTGQSAALAVCHAIDLAADGTPVHLDLSAAEATLAMGPFLEVGALLLATGGAIGAKRYGAPASFYRCTDGLIRISAMEEHQWLGVVAAMGSPPWAERFSSMAARVDDPDGSGFERRSLDPDPDEEGSRARAAGQRRSGHGRVLAGGNTGVTPAGASPCLRGTAGGRRPSRPRSWGCRFAW